MREYEVRFPSGGDGVRITQHYWNRYRGQPVTASSRPRPITRKKPHPWDTPNEEVKPEATLAFAGKGDFVPGDWCRRCKLKATCKARAEWYLDFSESYLSAGAYAAREREQLRKMEKAMDGVGWTAAIITGLLVLLVVTVQIGKRFYG